MAQCSNLILETSLIVSGLDAAHWKRVFEDALKISRIKDLIFENEEVFDKVKGYARDAWEKQMLRDYLRLGNAKVGMSKRSAISERNELAKTVLPERQNTIRELEKKKVEQRLLEEGLTVKGILFTNDILECLKARDTILVPQSDVDVHYLVPSTSSSKLRDTSRFQHFNQVLKQVGYHAAVSLNEEGWGFYEDAKPTVNPKAKVESRKQNEFILTAVSMAHCVINTNTVRFSDNAMAQLKKLGENIAKTEDEKKINEACKTFLQKFGSHVNFSTVEFGGLCQEEVISGGIRTGISSHVRGVLGGSKQTDGFDKWKENLIENMNTWEIINRGATFQEHYKAIWELILECQTQIIDVKRLCYYLKQAWQNEFSPSSLSNDDAPMRCIVQGLGSVGEEMWRMNALNNVQQLYRAVAQSSSIDNSRQCWTDAWKYRRHIQQFFCCISQMDFPDQTATYIEHLTKDLIEMSRIDSNSIADEITDWLKGTDTKDCLPPMLEHCPISDISSLLEALRSTFCPYLYGQCLESPKEGSLAGIAAQANKDFSLMFEGLKNKLLNETNYHHLSFLVSISSLLQPVLSKNLRMDELKKVMEKIEQHWENLKKYESVGKKPMEAFLIFLHFSTESNVMEDVDSAMSPLGLKLEETVKDIIASPHFQWQELSNILKVLYVEKNDDVGKELTERNAGEWKDLLDFLGIDRYFPAKITLATVMGKQCEEGAANTEPHDIAWVFLKQLLVLNPQARESLYNCAVNKTNSASNSSGNESDDLDGFDEDTDESKTFDPLDVFLTVFSCCDLPLKQVVVRNMYLCNFAVPLIHQQVPNGALLYSLWPLRNLCFERDGQVGQLVDQPLNIVSFVRLGRPEFSKSNSLNSILNEGQEVFLTSRDGEEKTASNGLIECMFKVPVGQKTQDSKSSLMYLNLHGDARMHVAQREVLAQVSNVIVTCVDNSDLSDAAVVDAIRILSESSSQVILLLLDRDVKALTKKKFVNIWDTFLCQLGTNHSERIKRVLGFKGNKNRTPADIKVQLEESISKCLTDQQQRKILDILDFTSKESSDVDEINDLCQKGRNIADKAIASMERETAAHNDTQADDTSTESTAIEKEGARGPATCEADMTPNGTVEKERSVKIFMSGLAEAFTNRSAEFFLSWLELHENQIQQVSDKSEARGKISGPSQKTVGGGVNLEMSEVTTLDKCHLLQEAMKMYDSQPNLEPAFAEDLDKLPEIVAYLMVKGYPIKLTTDGTDGMPLTLMAAVFQSLEAMIGEKKLVTISELGSPCSWKPTKIDSMFGLLTLSQNDRKGISIRLVKRDDKVKSKTDYALLFQAFGQIEDPGSFQIVVGLSDVILLNLDSDIKSDEAILTKMTEVLLHMKPLNDGLKRSQKVGFIVQTAPEKAIKMQDLTHLLDKISREVATANTIENITSFRDIAELEHKGHVLDFSNEPYLSPEYFHKVSKLKMDFCTGPLKPESHSWQLTDIPPLLTDMGRNVKQGGLEFSFCNILATKAVEIIQSDFSALQCALGLILRSAGPQQDDTDLFTSVISQQQTMTFKRALEVTSKIQNSTLPVKYENLLQKYLNDIDVTLSQREARQRLEERALLEKVSA